MNRFLKIAPPLSGAAFLTVFVLFGGAAAQEKNIPDHSAFTDCQPCHAEKYRMWAGTGHSKAIQRVNQLSWANADCYACHTQEGFQAKLRNDKVDPTGKAGFHSITCQTCHKPGSNVHKKQLAQDPEKLCDSCHSQRAVLEGKGAQGIEDTRSFHSGVACVSCHMSDGNHYMKVRRPDDPQVAADSCTLCHKDNNRAARARQLPDWQAFYKGALDPVAADMATVTAALQAKPDALDADMQARLKRVQTNLGILQKDGSQGAHNLDFSLEILAQAKTDLQAIKGALKK